MRFSQRIGLRPVKDSFQIDGIDEDIRNSLWNVIYIYHLEKLPYHTSDFSSEQAKLINSLWLNLFKKPLDTIPYNSPDLTTFLKNWFFNSKWFDVYDFVEFIAQHNRSMHKLKFEESTNHLLEREMSGYRFVDGTLVQITKEEEIAEIEEAIQSSQKTILSGVNEHLKTALIKLADRKNPDYRNSIKESISAVESVSKIIASDPKAKLGKALTVIESQVGLHPALKKGFSAIYGYTSDEGGIRHALLDNKTCDFEDAKYMLVACSAFINYLITKAGKAGIVLN